VLRTFLCCLLLAGSLSAQSPKPQPLRLQKSIPLPGVEGRLDHLAIDLKNNRLFVSATGNGSVEVIDLKSGKVAQSVKGLKGPQGIFYQPDVNRLVVGSRDDGTVKFLDGASFAVLTAINKFTNADIIRYDAATKTVVAGYGDGALGFFDLTGKQLAELRLESHPESFLIERQGSRILVNTPTGRSIAVIDHVKKSQTRTWPLTTVGSNYAMAIDETNHRVFLGCRKPPRVVTLDAITGLQVDERETVGDVNDLFYDAARKRIYVSGGEGQVDVIRQVDANTYEPLAKVNTGAGARTSLYVPERNVLFVAIPHRGSQPAEIRVFDAVN
jgi:DNA-binding beta-propeller fold protein YncE